MTLYRISLIGFGGVNRALAELVATRNEEWDRLLGFRLQIVGVSDLHLGSLIVPNGIDPIWLTQARFDKHAFATLPGGSAEPRALEVVRHAPADIVVEATFTDARTGEPAISHCHAAFEANRSLVTTNKGPVALASAELAAKARRHGVGFEYEGAVMSGTPVIRMAKTTLAGAELTGFEGILNGTSNFVLGRMQDGMDFDMAVREAQALGYAEADPTADVEGFDVRLKVVILANELLGASVAPDDVACSGISRLTPSDLAEAEVAGERWKLVGAAQRAADGRVAASVEARRLPINHPLAGVGGVINAVTFSTTLLGQVTVTGPGAGRMETAYALLSDIVALHAAGTVRTVSEAAE